MSNIREFFHSTIASGVSEGGESLPENIKCMFMCAYDLRKAFVWNEIDSVRRIKEISYYSDYVNDTLQTSLYIRRTFMYQPASPRDLYEVVDELLPI